ncbi:hypothetical protein [Entomomonas asaccharolytica]|uniref:Uncharacterized protein n=1 Tax=Entomomonas asaccharolytica TaxID=2785331 RepID=A0A974NH80_9GAMM|nr:hypothetical protein [Entomomonas asaccharolytica]QQP86528.1 hypothetical protein JHT90_04625 [Entomomonas asaccharolytica]
MDQSSYGKKVLFILFLITIGLQLASIFLNGTYNIIILVISLIVGFFVWKFLTDKHTQQFIELEVTERASHLIGTLQQAIAQKALEEPLLSSQNSNPRQLNTRLHISSLYLLLCIVGIRQSKGKTNYVSRKQFNTLLEKTIPALQKVYIARGTKKERIVELIKNNYEQVKQLITTYCSYTKKYNSDPTLPIQAWFEEKSRINLSAQPYIFNNLSEYAIDEREIKLLQELCRPKKHSIVLEKVRDKTETFMRLINQTHRHALQQQGRDILDYHYIEKYLSAFLLIFGLIIIKESNGNASYMQSIEYQALKKKASVMIKSMILNSRYLGVESLGQKQIEQLVSFMDKQLPSVEMACLDYFKATQGQLQTPEIYLLDWFKSTTNTSLAGKTNLPFTLNQYVQQILSINSNGQIE